MQKWISFWEKRPILNVFVLIVYYLLVVLPHEQVGLFTVKLFGHLPRATYNLYVAVTSLIILCIALFILIPPIIKHPKKIIALFFTASTILFATLCFYILFVINIEVVHFFQYAGFMLLCFPLFQNYLHALIITCLAGVFDEAWQYFYLAPQRTDYYDMNDVIINTVGGGYGACVLYFFNVNVYPYNWKDFIRSKTFICLCFFLAIVFILILTPFLDIYPSNPKTNTFLLVKKVPTGFWSEIPPKVLYHIVLPLEGFIITALLLAFYSLLDKFSPKLQ